MPVNAPCEFLETIRSYADEGLISRDDSDEVMTVLQRHMAARVNRIVDELFTEQVDASALQIEIPNLRRCFDAAIARSDIATAASLIAPYAQLTVGVPWDIGGWAGELLTVDGIVDPEDELALLVLVIIDRHLNAQFREMKPVCERLIARIAQHGDRSAPWWAFVGYVYGSALSGDYEAVEALAHNLITKP